MNESIVEPGLAMVDNEEAADFARLEAMASNPTGETWSPDADQEVTKVDAVESMGALLGLISAGGGIAGFTHTAALWSTEKCNDLAAVAVPVFRKYPWGKRVVDFFETGAGVEELALGAVLVPMLVATAGTLKRDGAKPDQDKPGDTEKVVKAGEWREG